MTRLAIIAVLAACGGAPRASSTPAPAAEPVQTAPAAPVAPAAQPAPAAATRDQPPEVKLKLGHYRNKQRGIGAIVDLTHHEARLRFDGTATTQRLDPINHSRDSVSYGPTIDRTTLRVSDDGTIELWVAGGGDEPIVVERDGDADPL